MKKRADFQVHVSALDGVRGIAVLCILIVHAGYLFQGGKFTEFFNRAFPYGVGVDFFFVLSGFLITGFLLRSKGASNYFRAFYARRLLRIFPLYYATLIVVFTVSHFLPPVNSWLPPDTLVDRGAYFLYLNNMSLLWGRGFMIPNALGHFWTLAVEEQFYLVWPWIVLILPESSLLWLCFAGFAAGPLLRSWSMHLVQYPDMMVLPFYRMDGLMIGAAMVLLMRRFQMSAGLLWAIAGVGLCAWVGLAEFLPDLLGNIGLTAEVVMFAAFVALAHHQIRYIHPILTSGFLRQFGVYSYGIYVFHVPLYAFVSIYCMKRIGVHIPLAVPGALLLTLFLIGSTFLLSALCYRYFEAPILRLKTRFNPQFTVPPVPQPAAATADATVS